MMMHSKLIVIFSILLLLSGAQAHGGELRQSNEYTLTVALEQVNAGDDLPVEVDIQKIANPATGLTVTFTVVNTEAGINETKPTVEREAGHYYTKYNFTEEGVYEFTVKAVDEEGTPIEATFEIFSNGAGCTPGQENGCSPSSNAGIPNIEYSIAGAAVLLSILSLAFFGYKKKNWKTAGILVAIILGAAIIGYSLYITILSGAASSGIVTCTSDGKCYLTAHNHAYVPISICGEDYRLPIEKGSLQKAHTHEEKNVIHWHDRLPFDKENQKVLDTEPLTLRAFFEQIEVPFSSTQLADSQNNRQCPDGSNATLKMLVNGKNNTAFENYQWKDKDVIVLAMDGRSVEEIEEELRLNPIPFPIIGRE